MHIPTPGSLSERYPNSPSGNEIGAIKRTSRQRDKIEHVRDNQVMVHVAHDLRNTHHTIFIRFIYLRSSFHAQCNAHSADYRGKNISSVLETITLFAGVAVQLDRLL